MPKIDTFLPNSLKLTAITLSGLVCALPSFASDTQDIFSISGFGRIVAGTLDTDKAEFLGYDDHLSLRPNSLLGLQVRADASESVSITAQGVVRASEDVDSELKRLYITYQPEHNFAVRAGRLRVPFFMYSDVIDLGYSYHWINLPPQMYGAFAFPTFDGIDSTWGYSTGEYDVSFEGYIGHHKNEMNVNDVTTKYDIEVLGGLIASVRRGNIEFRASYHQGDVEIEAPELKAFATGLSSLGYFPNTVEALDTKSKVQVAQFGVRYDTFDYFGGIEWVRIQPKINTYMPKFDTYYITGGYVFDPVTVHLTYAHSKHEYSRFPSEVDDALQNTDLSDPRYFGLMQSAYGLQAIESARLTDSLDTWTLGARWDVRPQLALKADVTFLMGEKNETALFKNSDDDFDRRAQLYQVALEWVF